MASLQVNQLMMHQLKAEAIAKMSRSNRFMRSRSGIFAIDCVYVCMIYFIRCNSTPSTPFHHTITSPHHHIITSPHHHISTSSHHHIITSPRLHVSKHSFANSVPFSRPNTPPFLHINHTFTCHNC